MGWVVAFIVATIAITYAYTQLRQIRPQFVSRMEKFAEAPAFAFTDQDGKTVTTDDLKGSVWVANFIFTRCAGPCPLMTSRMAELNQKLGRKVEDVRLISVSVDPEFDTPAVLKEYAARVNPTPGRWQFLTGPKDKVEETIIKGFLQPLTKEPSGQVAHSTRFVLVDKDGWIRGFQDGNDPEAVQKLLMDIGDILREARTVNPKG
jgi:protein SCO1/2